MSINRMSRSIVLSAVFACAGLMLPNRASASPIVLDFLSPLYAGAEGLTSFGPVNDQGVNVTLTGTNGTLHRTSEGFGIDGPTSLDDSGEVGFLEIFGGGFAPPQSCTRWRLSSSS